MVLSRQLGTWKKNKVESWRQWSSGQSSRKRPEFPTWSSELDDSTKCIFPVGASFFQSSQLSWTHWSQRFPSSEFPVVLNAAVLMHYWKHYQCWMFILLSLEKRPLNPDLDHTPTLLNSRLVIALQCLQLATDSFQTTHWWICNFPTSNCVMFMSNGWWVPIHYIYNFSS
jgi:hypothetical protein